MTDNLPQFLERLMESMERELRDIGRSEVEYIEQLIGVPVVRDFGGNVVVRSREGEAPRKDQGILQGNVDHNVSRTKTRVTLAVGVSRPETPGVAVELDYVMNRPFMSGNVTAGPGGMNHARMTCDERIPLVARRQT